MKTISPSLKGRLKTSATAVIGLAALSACGARTAPESQVFTPQPVAAPQQTNGVATTQAIGEENGAYASPSDTYRTTFAVGEEDGAGPSSIGTGSPAIGEVEGNYERIFIPE